MEELQAQEQAIPYSLLSSSEKRQRLQELAIVFFRLGAIAFGGPAAHIAMMDEQIVQQRGWLSRERLLDLLGMSNLIPGPTSTELAIHIGYERGGWRGLIVAGTCFIVPAMLIVWALAALYVQYRQVPQLGWLLYGIKPVILAIVVQALWKLSKAALKDIPTWLAAVAVIGFGWLGSNEIVLLLVAGLVVAAIKNWQNSSNAGLFPLPLLLAQTQVTSTATEPANWIGVFLSFLKIGSVLYGSGYVLLAFLQQEFVDRLGWLKPQELLDAIAIGQFTPGPLFTTATFIGYLLAGNAGAIAGTVGIFLPAFVLVALVSPHAAKLRRSRWTAGFLDGVNAASLGLMALVIAKLATAAVIDWVTIGLAIAAGITIFRFKLNSAWLVLAGGILGWLAKTLQLI